MWHTTTIWHTNWLSVYPARAKHYWQHTDLVAQTYTLCISWKYRLASQKPYAQNKWWKATTWLEGEDYFIFFTLSSEPRQPVICGHLQEIKDVLSAVTGRRVSSHSPQESKDSRPYPSHKKQLCNSSWFFWPGLNVEERLRKRQGGGRLFREPGRKELREEKLLLTGSAGDVTPHVYPQELGSTQDDIQHRLHSSRKCILIWAAVCPTFGLVWASK